MCITRKCLQAFDDRVKLRLKFKDNLGVLIDTDSLRSARFSTVVLPRFLVALKSHGFLNLRVSPE